MSKPETPSPLNQQIVAAIRAVRTTIRWKPGKDIQHLNTRKDHGHLPKTATIDDYHDIIRNILLDSDSEVYLYHFGSRAYLAVVAKVDGKTWLVMFGLDGLMETAFVVEWPEHYLNRREFEFVGTLGALMI